MNDEPTFLDLVAQLTRPHYGTVDRDTGTELREEDGLLAQLRAAFFEGMGSSGGSQKGSKLPLSSGAYDLLNEITVQASEALASVDSHPTPFGHAEDYVTLWAQSADEDKRVIVSTRSTASNGRVFNELHEFTGYTLVQSWHRRVKDFFDPPKRIEITAACPNCGIRSLPKKVDGAEIQIPVLWFRIDRTTDRTTAAECDACSVDWPIGMLENFARMVGAIGVDEPLSDVVKKLLEK